MHKSYQAPTSTDRNGWITDPREADPKNIPEPLGWNILVRPYPVQLNQQKTSLILAGDTLDYMSYLTNIGRVVAVGPCCWTRPEHKSKTNEQFDWVKVGDFVSFPKNAGSRRCYKGVSYVLLVDDEINEKLIDPQVFDDDFYKIDIPEEHYDIYNIERSTDG